MFADDRFGLLDFALYSHFYNAESRLGVRLSAILV